MIEKNDPSVAAAQERAIFELIYPELSDLLHGADIDSGVLPFQEIADRSSVYFLSPNCRFFQIRFRKKSRYILVPDIYAANIPDGCQVQTTKADEGFIRIIIGQEKDVLPLVPLLRMILTNLIRQYHTFGCCSRYEKCSDVGKCIHPDPVFALGCAYRNNLDDGKVFYGKNRNIEG